MEVVCVVEFGGHSVVGVGPPANSAPEGLRVDVEPARSVPLVVDGGIVDEDNAVLGGGAFGR